MPQLSEHSSAPRVDRVGNHLPCGTLFLVVDSWSSVPAFCVFTDPHTLADDETGGGALFVILTHQVGGQVSLILGACSRQRSHHDTIAELKVLEYVRFKQRLAYFVLHDPLLLPC